MGDTETETGAEVEFAPRSCANCRALLTGDFCHQCGQEANIGLRNALRMFGEGVAETFEWDSRVRRTLAPLLFRPGYLSTEWVEGRRARYVRPVRLYLFVSIIFFIVFSVVTDFDTDALRDGLSVESTEEGAAADAAAAEGSGRRDWIDELQIDLPFFDEADKEELKDRLERLADNPDLLVDQARSLAPQMMFVLLPLFAFILKMLYLFARRYYAEHLVLALHTHSFLFIAFITLVALDGIRGWAAGQVAASWVGIPAGWLTAALWVWIPLYLFLAQRRFYRQGWFMTIIKYLLTGFLYFMMVNFALVGLLVISVMTA